MNGKEKGKNTKTEIKRNEKGTTLNEQRMGKETIT